MRESRISVFASVATGALLGSAGAAGGTPCSPASRNFASTYEPFQVLYAAPTYNTGVSIPTNMRMVKVLTSLGTCKRNAEGTPADISTTRSTPGGAMAKRPANKAMPEFVHLWGTPTAQVQVPFNPTTVVVSPRSVFEGISAPYFAAPLTMPLVPLQPTTGHETCVDDNSEEADHQGRKSRRKHPILPNQFLARFYIALQYLADVITVDVVCAFLFGRWAQRYYQRNRKNRTRRTRHRSFRRWSRFASRINLVLRNSLLLNRRAASSTVHKDRGEIDTDCPSAAEVGMMPPTGNSFSTSSPAIGPAIILVEGAEQRLSTPHAANIEAITDDTPQAHSPAASLPLAAVASTIGASPFTAGNAGDVATQQQTSREFIGWENIGREAYDDHSDEALMANTYDVQDFETFERNGRIFIAGFCSGLGIENLPRSYMFGE